MRSYSAAIKYDNDGNPFYGVYQGAHFIMECPSMEVAASTAEALSDEYKQGLNYGEGVGYNKANSEHDNSNAVDLGDPPVPYVISSPPPADTDTPQPENYEYDHPDMTRPMAPPPPPQPVLIVNEGGPGDGPGDDITRITKGDTTMLRPNRKQRQSMGWEICDADAARLWHDQYNQAYNSPLTEGSTRGGTGAIKNRGRTKVTIQRVATIAIVVVIVILGLSALAATGLLSS